MINLVIKEHGLEIKNPFANIYLPEDCEHVKRASITPSQIKIVQQRCIEKDDSLRWLCALISDTELRLAEAFGLVKSDIILDHEVPHVIVQTHPWRSLKTESSQTELFH